MSIKDQTLVGIIIGSDSDLPVVQATTQTLEKLGVGYEITIASAHRTPDRVRDWVKEMEEKNIEVFITGAGGAAHLPGVVAAQTIKPVIGIPMPTLYFSGEDSLLSIVQMPSGIPVATMAVGKAGATNAAILALQIIANKHVEAAKSLSAFKASLSSGVEKKAKKLSEIGVDQYIETM